ncbi:hypothetical protein [Arcanobacterium phocae]|uniref:hypothetical protein n=1 Tax=Arcanobacterium phocae TaxID=131112 RepID=UPI00155F83CA|nr:hypothetical protein [Arcanobacterium phocae]
MVGDSFTSDADEYELAGLAMEVPEDAHANYTYVFTHFRDDGKEEIAKLLVYKNYPYVTLTGITMVTPLTWDISNEEMEISTASLAHKSK